MEHRPRHSRATGPRERRDAVAILTPDPSLAKRPKVSLLATVLVMTAIFGGSVLLGVSQGQVSHPEVDASATQLVRP